MHNTSYVNYRERPLVLDFPATWWKRSCWNFCLVIFPLIPLKKDKVSSLNQKGVKAVVLGPESSDTEIKDAFEGKCKVGLFTKSVLCQVGFEYRSRV